MQTPHGGGGKWALAPLDFFLKILWVLFTTFFSLWGVFATYFSLCGPFATFVSLCGSFSPCIGLVATFFLYMGCFFLHVGGGLFGLAPPPPPRRATKISAGAYSKREHIVMKINFLLSRCKCV